MLHRNHYSKLYTYTRTSDTQMLQKLQSIRPNETAGMNRATIQNTIKIITHPLHVECWRYPPGPTSSEAGREWRAR